MKTVVARAVFAEVALSAGTWSPGQMERLVGRLAQRPAHLEERSNKFRNMLRHSAIASPGTVAEIKRALPFAELARWLNHPLFFLLDARSFAPSFARAACLYGFDSLAGPIRFHLWHREVDDTAWSGTQLRTLDEPARLAVMRSPEADVLTDLDRLIFAVVMARQSALDAHPKALAQAQWIASCCAAEAIALTPQLLVGWKSLMPSLHEVWLPSPTAVIDPMVLRPGAQFKALASAVGLLAEVGHLRVPPDVYDQAALQAFLS